MPNSLGYILQVGIDVLSSMLGSTTDPSSGTQTGTLLLGLGTTQKAGNTSSPGYADSQNAELWQQSGYCSRPANPTAGLAACQALCFRQNDREVVFATRDNRSNQIYGNLAPGETCVYAAGADGNSQGRVMIKDDGSVTLFTTDDNTATGNATYFRLHPTDGMCFVAKWGSLHFDQTGFHVTHASGVTIDAGSVGGMPPPFSTMSSYFKVTAGSSKLNSPQVYLGSSLIGLNPAAYGFAAIPLTMPGIPISPVGFGVPCGLFTSSSVRIGI